MARKPNNDSDNDERQNNASGTYFYRGQKIEVSGQGEKRARGEQPRLRINGQVVDVEETPSGVLSHAFMFREFANTFELAEELVKQWGQAKIENPSFGSDHDHGDHDHGDHDH